MDFRLIAYFVAVVDNGGMTKAASALFVSQPSLSQSIRQLERNLGVQLFDRSGRSVVLTAEGESFLVAARHVLLDIEASKKRVSRVVQLDGGRLDLAAAPAVAMNPLPGLAAQMRRANPKVALNVLNGVTSAGVVTAVRTGAAEVGLIDLSVARGNLESMSLGRQEIVVVGRSDLLRSYRASIPRSHLSKLPILSELSDPFLAHLVGGDKLIPIIESAHRSLTWSLVEVGVGVTLGPRPIAEARGLIDVSILSLEPRLSWEIGIVYRPGPLAPAAEAFLALAGDSALLTPEIHE